MSLKKLRAARKNSFDELTKQMNSVQNSASAAQKDDDNYWKPTCDKAGNGSALIRFLPAPDGEVPFVRYFRHAFQGPTGSWYIEKSLTTIGQNDPVSELNSKLWNSGLESDKDIARKQKRQQKFVSNIYVIKDPSNPENEGKVFKYEYGKIIFDKINAMMNPPVDELTGEAPEPINPFDLWDGANFELRMKKKSGYPNYDDSKFQNPSALSDDEDALEEIYDKVFSLKEYVDPSTFKSYDDLKAKLNRVLGESGEVYVKSENTEKKKEFKPREESPFIDDEDVDLESELAALADED
jgi:hypothetical protein